MKKQHYLSVLRILLTVLFILFLLAGIFSTTVTVICRPAAITHRLQKTDFFNTFAKQQTDTAIEKLESIVAVDTEKLQAAVPVTTIEQELESYVDSLNRMLFSGDETLHTVSISSAELQTLINASITADIYAGNTVLMEADRAASYKEVTDTVNSSLTFFPQSLFSKVATLVEQKTHISAAAFYIGLHRISFVPLPALLAAVICAVGAYLLGNRDRIAFLRRIAGICFITASAVFLPVVFLGGNAVMNRLSLTDGLLRRYILTVSAHISSGIFSAVLIFFIICTVFFVVMLYLTVKTGKNTQKSCKHEKNVLEY